MSKIDFTDHYPEEFSWFCEPAKHYAENGNFVIIPDSNSDFWQRTHYGFRNNNGHCFWKEESGDFVLKTHVRYEPQNQFDQAGLIVYHNEDNWIKCSVEHEPEAPFNLGSVVTNRGYSDWATQPFSKRVVDLEFMIKHVKEDFEVYCKEVESSKWQQLRICHLDLPADAPYHIGVYACSPKVGGFKAIFESIEIDKN